MKKSLIALAVAGTLVAPAAMADTSNVNVYGQINMSIDAVRDGDKSGSASANQVNSNQSRIGFKGSEDLGGGLSAVYQLEYDVWADSSAGAWSQRNTFAGLKSDAAGTLTLGNQDTPYKVSTRNLDLFADGIADNRSLMGWGGWQDARLTDTIAYTSPSMSGFSVAAAYAMGAEYANDPSLSKGKAISLAAMYDMAPFYATIAHQKTTYGDADGQFEWCCGNTDVIKANKIGGSYKMDMFAINAVYETLKENWNSNEYKSNNLYLAGQYNITGNDAVKLAYTKASDGKLNGTKQDDGARQVSVGYDHNLSKRTSVYALYTKLSNDIDGNATLSGATTGGAAYGGYDSDPSAFSFGMKHSF